MTLQTSFPYDASSYGFGLDAATGNRFYVDSGATNASDGNLGNSPLVPLATLNGAIAKCEASNADFVYLMPGHAENVDSATSQLIDKAGVTVIGLGRGTDAPTFTYTATAGSFEIDAANVTVQNVRFVASVTAVVVGVNVDAAYITLDGCEWNFDATGDDFLTMVDVDTVDYCTIQKCKFRAQPATAGAAQAIRLDKADWARILWNEIFGDYSVAAIFAETAASLQILIAHNTIYNDDTASTNQGIDLSVACTGVTDRNTITGLQATSVAAQLDPGSCLNIENYACNAIDEKGILVGGTAST